jgi:MFS family permease
MSNKKEMSLPMIIAASSVGTLIEWYDFYIFGSLATIISTQFFPKDNPTAAFLSTLATFAAGFVVRPFGALFFGRLGDLIGRKYTFMVTLLLMGGATFAIGCIPGYETIGFFAPLIVLILRLLQGLALGGEYGGAATYVAEHSPSDKRGFWTSWIQITATAGLFISLIVIIATKKSMSPEDFDAWGWRIPFWISILMVYVSFLIRRNMHESPLFAKAKSEGKTATNPLAESFGNKYNFKYVLVVLFGGIMGQGVVWYTAQFYAQNFMLKTMNLDFTEANMILITALVLGTPFFIVFASLSDKVGRKWIILFGILLGALSFRPLFEKMYQTTNLKNKTEVTDKTTVDVTRALAKGSETDSLITTTTKKEYEDGTKYKEVKKVTIKAGVAAEEQPKPDVTKTISNIQSGDKWTLIALIFVMLIFTTMAYGPVAAYLVELFPVKIRYTSMSLPYHIGNGVFGGLMPAIATYLGGAAKAANEAAEKAGTALPYDKPYLEGLWYPILIAGIAFVVGAIYLKEGQHKDGGKQ